MGLGFAILRRMFSYHFLTKDFSIALSFANKEIDVDKVQSVFQRYAKYLCP